MVVHESHEEKKNQRIGWILAILLHVVLIALFLFMVVWKEQIPPPEPIGMSINFGTSDSGSGNVQPMREQTTQDEITPEAEQPVDSEAVPEPPTEAQTTPVNPVTDQVQKESPVVVEKKTTPVETKPVQQKPVETKPVVEKPVEKPAEEKPKLQAIYTGPKSNTTNDATSQGTKEGTTGDQGSKEGSLDSKSMYGGPGGGGGGFSHNFTGWGTNFHLPDNKPEATGVLEFKITIDDRGDVVKIDINKMIGNPEAEKFYKDLIIKEMKFYRTDSKQIPPFSEGTITLNLKVK